MSTDISRLRFPAPSGHCKKAIEILSGPDADIKTLELTIEGDDTLANAVIRYSNSPVHHRDNEIADLGTATNILGLKNVYIVLVTAVLKGYIQDSIVGNRILHHCLTISALTSMIAAKISKQMQHEMELLGILHALPSLVLCHNFQPEYRALVKGMTHTSPPLAQLEQDIFHVSRRDLIDASMRELALPDTMRNTLVAYHSISKPGQAEADKALSILSLAHHMELSVAAENLRMPDSLPGEKEKLRVALGLSEADYGGLINACQVVINDHIALVA